MKSSTIILGMLLLSSIACKKEYASSTASVQSTIPACIQQIISDHEANYPEPFTTPAIVVRYEYQSQEVFLYDPDPAHAKIRDWMYKVFDAQCQEVCNFGGGFANLPNTCADFEKNAVKVDTIWTHK